MMLVRNPALLAIVLQCLAGAACVSPRAKPAVDESVPVANLLGVWEGNFDQHSHDLNYPYPMILIIETVTRSGGVAGTMEWPVPNQSRTTFSGNYVNDVLYLHEESLLEGKDIILDGNYYAFLTDQGNLRGRYVCRDGDHAEAFELRRSVNRTREGMASHTTTALVSDGRTPWNVQLTTSWRR